MISDAELHELEVLFIEKFELHDFGNLFFNEELGEVLISDIDFKMLVDCCFEDRHEIRGEYFVISIEIFKILQFRYFRNNETVFF